MANNIDYTALYLASVINRALSPLHVDALAYVQACYAFLERAFQLAEISTPRPLHLPATLRGLIARQLVSTGEFVGKIEVVGRTSGLRIEILPAQSQTVLGADPLPSHWLYQLTIPSPTGTSFLHELTSAQVIHPRQGCSLETPWQGRGSLQLALASGTLGSRLEEILENILNSPVGHIIPIPENTDGAVVQRFKADVEKLQGSVAMPESTQGGFGLGAGAAPKNDWVPQALKPVIDAGTIQAREQVGATMCAALGVPSSLIGFRNPDGTQVREDLRRCLHTTIEPMGNLLVEELQEKLEDDVTISFNRLEAADIQGRGRAFASITDEKLTGQAAAAIAGFGPQEIARPEQVDVRPEPGDTPAGVDNEEGGSNANTED